MYEEGIAALLSFDELWKDLNDLDETVEIEAKTSLGSAVLETVSAFANEPGRGGGYFLFGVRMATDTLFPTYEIVGVEDADQLQADLATQCRAMLNRPTRPEMVVENREGRRVIVAYIPEAQPSEKPVYITSRGLPKGAFRRIGSTDQKCTDDDLTALYQAQPHASFDETPADGADVSDIDPEMLNLYRAERARVNPDAPELAYDDGELLRALSCAVVRDGEVVPTLAGLMLFGKHSALRRLFPMVRVDYIRVPGREWVPTPDERFDSIDMLGPLFKTIPRAINAILDDIPKAFHLPADSDQRQDIPLLPRMAVREAVVNAVMHRSYRQRQPIQIIRYSNRLELRNPGHSLVPDDRLGEPGSVTRNEKIAAVLHETNYAETKGSGIRAMREALAQAGLTPPTFESDREKDCFVVTFLFHHFLNREDAEWLGRFRECDLIEEEAKALVYAREVGAINNAAYRDINRVETLVASGHLRRLRDLGLLEQKGKSVGTYYVPTLRLLEGSPDAAAPGSDQATGENPPLSQGVKPLTQGVSPLSQGVEGLPQELTDAVQGLGERASPSEVRDVVRRLCEWKPLSAQEIAKILGRGQAYASRTYLAPMIRDGDLAYTIPDTPSHQDQKYRAT